LTEFDIIAREVSGYRTRFEAIEKRLAEVEQVNAGLESAGSDEIVRHGGDFEALDAVYEAMRRSEEQPISEQAERRPELATRPAEKLSLDQAAARAERASRGRQGARPAQAQARRPTPGRIRAPRPGGGARLSRVEVVFEVASERYPLDERAATLMAENLRVKAAHEPGAEGTVGARAVADAIELRLIEDTADPITLGGDEAEAVFYAPAVPNGGSDLLSALRDAVERLHDEWIR
jgi:hypothetical protein